MSKEPTSHNLRILLIDDDEMDFILTREVLNQVYQGEYSYQIDWEPDGELATEALITNAYDLYLLDYHIGPWNGIEILKQVAEKCENPIIMLTDRDQYDIDKSAMDLGAWDFLLKRDLNPKMIERVIRYTTQRKATMDALKIQATRDELTQLCNRREFNQQLKHEIASAERHQHPLCLAMSDIDFFKTVNDQYGHSAGDLALIRFGEVILETIRSDDIAARFGGDEFAIIFPHVDPEGAFNCTERIRETLKATPILSGTQSFSIHCSFGITQFRKGMTDTDFINSADEALYQAKAKGRDCSHIKT